VSCEEMRAALPVYLDGELEPSAALEVERHLRGCPACAAIADNERALRSAYRDGSFRVPAPAGFSERVYDALAARARATTSRREAPSRWLGLAASFVLGVAVAAAVARVGLTRSPDQVVADEVLSSHLRSLEADHLTDVPSSDQHTVKPWFAGRLDFSPVVPDLAAEGFPLAGGRLDYLDGRSAAALVYRRRLHVINVFSWPSASGAGGSVARATKNGYHTVRWGRAGIVYWAVSDVDPRELERFVELYQSRVQ